MTNADLRQMVRDILREVVPAKGAMPTGIETVRISSDADLMAFARRVIEVQSEVAAGRLRFSLAAAGPAPQAAPFAAATTTALQGVVTEHVVDKHAGNGVLVLAPGAVITPLARDRARKLNLRIERNARC
jgi:hypothetical protein